MTGNEYTVKVGKAGQTEEVIVKDSETLSYADVIGRTENIRSIGTIKTDTMGQVQPDDLFSVGEVSAILVGSPKLDLGL